MSSTPPPAGSRKASAQLPAGEVTGVSGVPLSVAFQPPAGSASSMVPPAAGARAPETPVGPDGTATTVPLGSTTRTRADNSVTRHR